MEAPLKRGKGETRKGCEIDGYELMDGCNHPASFHSYLDGEVKVLRSEIFPFISHTNADSPFQLAVIFVSR